MNTIRNTNKKSKNLIIDSIPLTQAGGKGVAIGTMENGKKLLVKYGAAGDTVKAEVYKSKSKYAEARILEILDASPDRRNPPCIHFGECGGCSWQHITYEAQLALKNKEVQASLTKIAKIEPENFLSPVGAPDEFFYRNKMEFSFSDSRWITSDEMQDGVAITERNGLGFHKPGMWNKILDLKECLLQQDPSNAIRLFVKKVANEKGLSFWNTYSQEGNLRSLMLRNNNAGEFLVFFQLGSALNQDIEDLFKALIQEFSSIKSLQFAINTKQNDSIYDLDCQLYYGESSLIETLAGLQFRIGPKSFFQTNIKQAEVLYALTVKAAELLGDEVIYDLYCGTGTISQIVAKGSKKVVGIESVPEAIAAAEESLKWNSIENCSFACGDMKDLFTEDFVLTYGKPDVVITDPPRDGMHPKVVAQLLTLSAKRIVYVSCNPATQARDIALLAEKYRLKSIQAVDLFPQTFHCESIAVLELR